MTQRITYPNRGLTHNSHFLNVNPTLLQAITLANSTAGLSFCVDAGDINSVATTTAIYWLDTSTFATNLVVGVSSATSTVNSPEFYGTPGALNIDSYWGWKLSNNILTTSSQALTPTFMQSFHKAGAVFSILALFYPSSAASGTIMGTVDNVGVPGWNFERNASGSLRLVVCSTASPLTVDISAGAGVVPSQWHLVGMSLTAATTIGIYYINGNVTTINPSYATATSCDSGQSFNLGSYRIGSNIFGNQLGGARFGGAAVWNGTALTSAQFALIDAIVGPRWGV